MSGNTGYESVFTLPIIVPPAGADAGNPVGYNASVNATVSITPTLNDAGIRIEVSPKERGRLFAMFSGLVYFLPPNAAIPDSILVAPPGGGLVLSVSLPDFSKSLASFPPGTPCVSTVVYLGLEQATVASALLPEVNKIGAFALQRLWATAHTGAPPVNTDFAADYLSRVMTGAVGVFVDGGAVLGEANAASLTTAAFELRVTDAGTPRSYISPLGLLKGAPFYDF